MATAEFAIGLLAISLVFSLMFSGLVGATRVMQCQEAAALGARLAARNTPAAQVRAQALRAAPPQAKILMRREGPLQMVQVHADPPPLLAWFWQGPQARSWAWSEENS